MLEKLKKFFEENEVDFEVRGGELIVPCPADCVPEERCGTMTQDEIIADEDVTVWTDEALIHIDWSEDGGFCLLVELPLELPLFFYNKGEE